MRTKSSVGGLTNKTVDNVYPLSSGRPTNDKMHLSSSQLLEESIGGVVGANCLNTLNSNQGQAIANMVNGPGGAAYMASHGKNKIVSPNPVQRKNVK
jgi:hypothetical protein